MLNHIKEYVKFDILVMLNHHLLLQKEEVNGVKSILVEHHQETIVHLDQAHDEAVVGVVECPVEGVVVGVRGVELGTAFE
jgi:hypothetical protein